MRHINSSLKIGAILLCTLIIYSCNVNGDNANNGETNVQDDIANINNAIDTMADLLWDYRNGEFSNSLATFLNASAGNINASDWITRLTDSLDDHIDSPSINANNRFNFNQHRGEYSWNRNTNRWVRSTHPSSIILKFPGSSTSTTNSKTLTISQYQDTTVIIDGENYYLPRTVTANLTSGNNEIFRLLLRNASYVSDKDIFLPSNLELEIYTASFTHNLRVSQNNSRHFRLEHSLKEGNKLAISIDASIFLRHASYADIEEADLTRLTARLMITDKLSVDADIQIGDLLTRENLSENQINSLFDAKVRYDGSVIGEIIYSEIAEDFLIIYKNGSNDLLDVYYDRIFTQIESIFYVFIGSWYR